MNYVTSFVAWASCVVILLTAWAMLQDARKTPHDRTTRGWIQHLARLIVLDLLTAFAGVLVVFPAIWPATVWSTGPLTFLASFMALSSPCPWWRYVFQDSRHAAKQSTNLHPQL